MKCTRLLSLLLGFFFFSPLAQSQSRVGGGVSKENLDLPYDALSLSEEDEAAPEIIVFYGQSYEGDGIYFCLDRSGSTRDGELDIEKRETIRSITEFSSRVQFAVIFYDAGVVKYPPSGRPVQADPAAKSAAISWVSNVAGGHGSCLARGVMEALNYINVASVRRNVIIWLGDGCSHCGGARGASYDRRSLTEVKSRNFRQAQINSICVGGASEVCESFPKTLAAENGGTYKRVPR